MHTGQMPHARTSGQRSSTAAAIRRPYPGASELEPLGLTESERADLVAFLKALEGSGAREPARRSSRRARRDIPRCQT